MAWANTRARVSCKRTSYPQPPCPRRRRPQDAPVGQRSCHHPARPGRSPGRSRPPGGPPCPAPPRHRRRPSISLTSASHLVLVLGELGEQQAALDLGENTLARMRRALSADHPQTLALADSLTALREQSSPEPALRAATPMSDPLTRQETQASRDSHNAGRDLVINNYAAQPQAAESRPWGNVPLRNPSFTGREDILAAVREALLTGGNAVVQALHGMGGSARRSWRSSMRTGLPIAMTWCGGSPRSGRR